jgi:hypothetical protein
MCSLRLAAVRLALATLMVKTPGMQPCRYGKREAGYILRCVRTGPEPTQVNMQTCLAAYCLLVR